MFIDSYDIIHQNFCVMTSATFAVTLNRNYVTNVWSQTDGVWRLLACKPVAVTLSSYQLMDSFYLQWTEEIRDENISFSFCLLFRARYGKIALLSLNIMLMKLTLTLHFYLDLSYSSTLCIPLVFLLFPLFMPDSIEINIWVGRRELIC
jgi:hypothetical protein